MGDVKYRSIPLSQNNFAKEQVVSTASTAVVSDTD